MRSPCLRTLPSSTCETRNRSATTATSTSLPLNAKQDVREGTRSSATRASASSNSSARPSAKYSWSCPGLISTNGRTARDRCSRASRGFLALIGTGAGSIRRSTAASSESAETASLFSRAIPDGVSSNAHASISDIGKPAMTSATTSVTVHFGSVRAGNRTSAAWMTPQPTTTYTVATLTTLRRRSSLRNAPTSVGLMGGSEHSHSIPARSTRHARVACHYRVPLKWPCIHENSRRPY